MARRARLTGRRVHALTRRHRAWELAVAGWSQRAIAHELGVSQPAVSKMLDRAATELTDDTREGLRRAVALHGDQLRTLWREALSAWEASKHEQTRRRHQRRERSQPGASGGTGTHTLVELTARSREGDPRFLRMALHALRGARELWALAGLLPRTPEELQRDTVEQLQHNLRQMSTEQLLEISAAQREPMLAVVAPPPASPTTGSAES